MLIISNIYFENYLWIIRSYRRERILATVNFFEYILPQNASVNLKPD
jgi:hypothetical protein